MSDWNFLNKNRVRKGIMASDETFGFNGLFEFALTGEARRIRCIASDGGGWRHVSVSFGPNNAKTPSWELMCRIKDLFWNEDNAVIQIHPPKKDYVNHHPGCLHLWESLLTEQPLPPSIMVGPKQ